MVFNEIIKLEVKKKSHYKCCICQSFEFLHVHHIVPEGENGPDTIDNAAPLCTKCHDNYGANPEKRKWIGEKRDFWYEYCEKKLSNENLEELKRVYDVIEEIKEDQSNRITDVEGKVKVLQQTIQSLTEQNQRLVLSLNNATQSQKENIFSRIGSVAGTITGSSIAMTQLGSGVYANPTCPRCGSRIGLYVSNQAGPPTCPNCGALMV